MGAGIKRGTVCRLAIRALELREVADAAVDVDEMSVGGRERQARLKLRDRVVRAILGGVDAPEPVVRFAVVGGEFEDRAVRAFGGRNVRCSVV